MDVRACYNCNGNFDAELFYVSVYDNLPCKYEYAVDDDFELELTEMSLDKIKHLFKNITQIRTYTADYVQNESEVKKAEGVKFPWDSSAKPNQKSIVFAADDMVFYIKNNGIVTYYPQSMDISAVMELTQKTFNLFPRKEIESKAGKVSLVKAYQGDYYTSEQEVKPKIIDVEENYNDDFLPIYNKVVEFLEDRSSGLVLFWGNPGTGKTSIIRHLISAVPKEYIVVPLSIASRLGDADLTTFITDHTDSVFILEDCEKLLEDRGENPFNDSISTILNMADGLLSDIVNIKFICTFNAPLTRIDPALLRKGRCIAEYKFTELKAEKVAVLNEKYNLGHTEIKDMSLAEVYNANSPDFTEEKKEIKIGF